MGRTDSSRGGRGGFVPFRPLNCYLETSRLTWGRRQGWTRLGLLDPALVGPSFQRWDFNARSPS